MHTYQARVTKIHLVSGSTTAMQDSSVGSASFAEITCPQAAVPRPGQYTLAIDEDSILGAPLYTAGHRPDGFLCAPPIPPTWLPGTSLTLYGPLGRGFQFPNAASGPADASQRSPRAGLRPSLRPGFHLALVAAGGNTARLLHLASDMLASLEVALFSDAPLPPLPASLEAYPLADLPESLAWADFLAIDTPVDRLDDLRAMLFVPSGGIIPCPGEILVDAPMPCAGLGECGVCAIRIRRARRAGRRPTGAGLGWKLACKDGPVFDLEEVFP